MPRSRWPALMLFTVAIVVAMIVAACTDPAPPKSNAAPPSDKPATVNLVRPTEYYPLAYAGEDGWLLKGTLHSDFNGDGNDETLYIIHKPQGHGDEGPWQAYIEDAAGRRTHIFAQYLNHQTLRAFVGATPKTVDGNWSELFLFNHGSVAINTYQVVYNAPDDFALYELSSVLPLFWDEQEVR